MVNKQVYKYQDIRQEILKAVDIICDPIKNTLSPKGLNVIFEDDAGNLHSSNDGATIARNLNVKDPLVNAIIQIYKSGSLKTNSEAGDATSTTLLLSQILTHEGFRLIDAGVHPTDVKKELEKFAKNVTEILKKGSIKIKNNKDLENVATISANNDREIGRDVVRTIKVAGLDGMVFIEPNHNKPETEIIEEKGFKIDSGLFARELVNNARSFSSTLVNPVVFMTDKRLYYAEEAETILKTALLAGHKNIVVVARDFIGQAPNVFISNHGRDGVQILLIKDAAVTEQNADTLHDLAAYLGGTVVMEKNGSLVDNITIADFCVAARVFADPRKALFTTLYPNRKALKQRIKALRAELERDKDDKNIKGRLASLTNGVVTLKVGAFTQIQMEERMYRYEDAINATRRAIENGYLVGGGVALKSALAQLPEASPVSPEFANTFKKICEASIRQIATNCGEHPETILRKIESSPKNYGYNALSGKVENLLAAGVIDSYRAVEMAVNNSVSIVGEVIGAGYLFINDLEDNKE